MISEILAGFPPGPVISNLPSRVLQEVAILGCVPVKLADPHLKYTLLTLEYKVHP